MVEEGGGVGGRGGGEMVVCAEITSFLVILQSSNLEDNTEKFSS